MVLRPEVSIEMLKGQAAFRSIGNATTALVKFTHHATFMMENNSYVRRLLVDFSKGFDVVHHSVLLSEISMLDLIGNILYAMRS